MCVRVNVVVCVCLAFEYGELRIVLVRNHYQMPWGNYARKTLTSNRGRSLRLATYLLLRRKLADDEQTEFLVKRMKTS